jgi:hypothetical protein
MLAEPVAQHLAAAGLVSYTPAGLPAGDWPCFLDELPDRPDQAVMVRNTDGLEPVDRMPFDMLGLQIAVRGTKDHRVSEAKAWAVFAALDGLASTTLPGGLRVIVASAQQPPVRLGQDDAGRHRHSLNLLIEVASPVAMANRSL